MRDVEVIENGITFNRSTKIEHVVVHNVTVGLYFGIGGITESKKTMFVGTEAECNTYIVDNGIIIPEEE